MVTDEPVSYGDNTSVGGAPLVLVLPSYVTEYVVTLKASIPVDGVIEDNNGVERPLELLNAKVFKL